MAKVTVSRRVRPLRFAFLVKQGDMRGLRDVFRVNTVLWGGAFNPIIPAMTRSPRWVRGWTGREIVNGYLRLIDPDVVVACNVDASHWGIPPERTRPLEQFKEKFAFDGLGLNVTPVYQWRYDKVYQFMKRHPARLATISAPEDLSDFSAACFGQFGSGPHEAYSESFATLGAAQEQLCPETFLEQLNEIVSPLRVGSAGLDVARTRHAFVVMDPHSFDDLVDFWNLRALGWFVIPIPAAWAALLAPTVRSLIHKHTEQRTPSRYWATRLARTRCVEESTFRDFLRALASKPDAVLVQSMLPRIWEPTLSEHFDIRVRELNAAEDRLEIDAESDSVSFDALPPPFLERDSYSEEPQWANVIQLASWSAPFLATVFPPDLADPELLLARGSRPYSLRASTEGLVLLDRGRGGRHYWTLPSGAALFRHWLKPRYALELSSPGRLAQRMVELLGDLHRTRTVAHPLVLELLQEVGRSASRSASHHKFLGKLKKRYAGREVAAENVLKLWLDRKVLGIGLNIQCPTCSQITWFALEELRRTLRCARCLDDFDFPAERPENAVWAVRPLGPFSVENHAQGAYAVCSALRFFQGLAPVQPVSWIPSATLKAASGEVLEADFMLLMRPRFSRHSARPVLLVGECKTLGNFHRRDLVRMRGLAAELGAIAVFTTLRKGLTRTEVRLLAGLARAGRRQGWRMPVMVLTATELLADDQPPYCWQHAGGESKLIGDQIRGLPSLLTLCDATQQLYLGLPAGDGWPNLQ